MPLVAAARPADVPTDPCATLPACLDRMIALGTTRAVEPVERRLRSFGPTAVDALIPLLRNGDPGTRSVAGMTLAGFDQIDERHLPALIAAHREGNGWLPRAIAATGTDEALTYLQARFLEKPDFGSNAQVHMALLKFGDRARPFVLSQLEACRHGASVELCRGVLAIPTALGGTFPDWAIEATLALADAPAALPDVRKMGEDFAIQRRHALALPVLRSRLEGSRDRWEIKGTIGQIGRYGAAAADFGPRLLPFLASDDPEIRAEAALALGRIGSRVGAAELIALEPRFEDEWVLAYNAVEALGRIRAGEARPLLERVAARHWHRGVRNNAGRALRRLAGEAGEAAPYPPPQGEDGEEYLYIGDLRYAGDDPTRCAPLELIETRRLGQDPPEKISWPARGAQRLEFRPLAESSAGEVRPMIGQIRSSARIPFRVPLQSGGFLTGYDQGEWGGGVVRVSVGGEVEQLAGGNAKGAFRIGRRLYVVQGLSHLVLSNGNISVFAGDPPRLIRATRLPAEPYEILATDRRAVLVRTRAGDLAIREDGSLADPESLGLCAKADR